MSLSEQDEIELVAQFLGQRITPDASYLARLVTPAVERIVAREVAAALMDAAERVAEFDEDDNFHDGDFIQPGGGYYAAIERACLLLGGQINDWRDRKPQIHN